MKHFTSCLRNNLAYFLCIAVLVDIAFILHLAFGQEVFFMPVSSPHPVWLNVFLVNYTFIGDTIFAIALILFTWLYLRKNKLALQLTVAILFCELIVQLLKNIFIPGAHQLYFESGQYLFFLDEQYLINSESMPSGHTAIAFTIITLLVINMEKKKWTVLLIMAGLLMGFSRMYLAQHSLAEVLVGVLVGVFSGTVIYAAANSIRPIKISFNKWKRHKIKHIIRQSPELQPG